MKVTNLGAATINPDGSVSMMVTVAPDNQLEASFLGFAVAAVNLVGVANAPAPLAAIASEATALKISIPGLTS
jgi:hypothetical protein